MRVYVDVTFVICDLCACVCTRIFFAIVCVCVFVCLFVCLFICVFICWRDCGCALLCMLTSPVLLDLAHDTCQRNAGGASGVMCRVLSLVAACSS